MRKPKVACFRYKRYKEKYEEMSIKDKIYSIFGD